LNMTQSNDLKDRNVLNFFNKGQNYNWGLNTIDPLALENLNKRCLNHPKELNMNENKYNPQIE
ncbi:14848_t:CDS:1, partial [Gigaspora margarita]